MTHRLRGRHGAGLQACPDSGPHSCARKPLSLLRLALQYICQPDGRCRAGPGSRRCRATESRSHGAMRSEKRWGGNVADGVDPKRAPGATAVARQCASVAHEDIWATESPSHGVMRSGHADGATRGRCRPGARAGVDGVAMRRAWPDSGRYAKPLTIPAVSCIGPIRPRQPACAPGRPSTRQRASVAR